MKLLTRTTLSYIALAAVVFILTGLISASLLNRIFRRQLDNTLNEEKLLIEQTINFSDSVPDFRPMFGHMIEVTILNSPQPRQFYIHDTLMYDNELGSFSTFRHLFSGNTSIRKKGYTVNIYKPLQETEQLITRILAALALVFLTLLILLILVNYFLLRRIWIPFYRILNQLNRYEINDAVPLEFPSTDIHEFGLLAATLEKMSKKIRADYTSLREFNENASHELQTPLAVIKSNLEMLIQKENLDEDQYRRIRVIMEATHRMSRLNYGLLLISRIENNQVGRPEPVDLSRLFEKTFRHFEEIIDHKGIRVNLDLREPCSPLMDPALAEVLVNNLVSNSIRHNIQGGLITLIVTRESLILSNTGPVLNDDPSVLFDRFRKSGAHPDSVGLGLSIVQKITALYGMKVGYTFREGFHTLSVDMP